MNTNNQGSTGTNHPVQGGPATDQGGYLGKAQGWASRVTGNLQGQAGQMKDKLVGGSNSSGTAAGSGSTGTGGGYNPTGTGAGYQGTNAGVGHHTQGNPPFSGPNTGYNPNAGYSNDMQPGHQTQPSHQSYPPSQTRTGHAGDGTHGSAPKPSYTEQAKQYTAKGADILHGQAEYLKGKLVGTQGTGAPAATNAGSGYGQGAGTGQGHVGGHVHRSGDPSMQSAAGGPQAKKSWTESAKQGLATGLTYTQQGLEVVKNKVGGPSGHTPGMTGTTGTHNTGHATTNLAGVQPGYNAGSQPNYNAGSQPGYNAGAQPAYDAGSQPSYNAGAQPGYNASSQPSYNAGAQPGYNASAQPGYSANSQPGYGANTNTKY